MGMNYRDGVTQAMDDFDKNQVGKHGLKLASTCLNEVRSPCSLAPTPTLWIFSLKAKLVEGWGCAHSNMV